MKQKNGEITIDLTALAPEDREIIRAHLARVQKFANDIPAIRSDKPAAADKLVSSFMSTQASVFAESEIIANKVRSGKVTLLPVGPHSTDAHYIQEKIGGIYTRLEIKSIIQGDASAVDKEIANAEVQHRDRLNDENGKPTWHKTTVVIGNPENPWPFSRMLDLEGAANDRAKLINEAETRIDRLLLGSMQHTKEIKREADPEFTKKLIAAEARSKKIETEPLTPIKRGPVVDASKHFESFSESSSKFLPSSGAQRPKISSNESNSTRLNKLRARKPHQQPKVQEPLTPISKMEKDREKARSKVIEKVSPLSPDSRINRKVLVTEQVTVICQHRGMVFVLDRQANKFTAHIKVKGEARPENKAKRERIHWDLSTNLVRQWRKSADPDGNSPLHLAILKEEIGLVKFFARPNMIDHRNSIGDLPIHLASKSNNPAMLMILLEKQCTVDIVDAQGNTPLHLACNLGNVEIIKILLESGANLDVKNKSSETPRSIIESSDNINLKEYLETRRIR